ncbi:hypothetical protein H7X87_02340 [Acetobacteraceae bacterium]|nr:hypothetical protein [Candidatus Parcubacteria bacterium]
MSVIEKYVGLFFVAGLMTIIGSLYLFMSPYGLVQVKNGDCVAVGVSATGTEVGTRVRCGNVEGVSSYAPLALLFASEHGRGSPDTIQLKCTISWSGDATCNEMSFAPITFLEPPQ